MQGSLRTLFAVVLSTTIASAEDLEARAGHTASVPPTVAPKDYLGVALGATPEEVLSKFGQPNALYRKENAGEPWYKSLDIRAVEVGRTIKNYHTWSYDSNSALFAKGPQLADFTIGFTSRTKIVESISCLGGSRGAARCPPLLGIIDGMSVDQLISRLGEPDSVEDSGGASKELRYMRFNVSFNVDSMDEDKRRIYILSLRMR